MTEESGATPAEPTDRRHEQADRRPGSVIDTVSVAGRTLQTRIASTTDAEGLLGLYHRLGPDDLHRRFFTGFRPELDWIERWIDRSGRGGVVLVVADGDRIIADAGYVPTASDVAELAMTIDPDHRGWLGPYLLDLLVEQARLDGITDLEGEVLTTNCGMLALLRARGCAFVPGDDPSLARVVIGTTGDAPVWPEGSDHPRILVEGSIGAWSGARAAARHGASVMVCPGPDRGRAHRCPLLSGDHCPLLDGADAVVVALPIDAPSTATLVDHHMATDGSADQPIALSARLRRIYGDIGGRITFDTDPGLTGDEAIAEVQAAIERAELPPADESANETAIDAVHTGGDTGGESTESSQARRDTR